MVRDEVEFIIDEAQYKDYIMQSLDRGISPLTIVKDRIIYGFSDKVYLDVFKGRNEGLRIAEVEFNTVEDAERYVPKKWFDKEVTEDSSYKNINLAEEK